jgi:Rho-type GTPase-activating protein 1/2
MNARNLGVVFGRKLSEFIIVPVLSDAIAALATLMRSSDLNREYADMAGKALAIEWLIENAPSVFREDI